jgi:bifunctional N-acetylglucosamine-1-phosphate-uridyltransferase/glucosamine-1-phosphate-acetyltransferase GlmU-like protein
VAQQPQVGTGHAVQVAWGEIASGPERVLVLAGDMPLVRTETLRRMLERHARERNGVTFLSGVLADPGGYGRVIRDDRGAFVKIVEEKDATAVERAVAEVNSGIYCFERGPLREALDSLRADNRQQEYYLTDTLAFLRRRGRTVGIEPASHASELMGVNTPVQLAEIEEILRAAGAAGAAEEGAR